MNEATREQLLARLSVIKAGIARTEQAQELIRVVTMLKDSALSANNHVRPLNIRVGAYNSMSVPYMAIKPSAKVQYETRMTRVLTDIRDLVVTRLPEELESLLKEQDRGLAEATDTKVAAADKTYENRENRGVRVRKP